MPSNRITPVTNEIYHVYNRGVEKRDIFCDRSDYVRFIHDLYEFNDTALAPEFIRRKTFLQKSRVDGTNVGSRTPHIRETPHIRDKIVDVISFCLMKNHFHLVLRQRKDGGIPLFMQKLGTGYTNAFNLKNERVGPLFQGRYKIKHVDRDEYLLHLIAYVHLNPLGKFIPISRDINLVLKKLARYRWSSHPDYLGIDNFRSAIDKKFAIDAFGGISGYKTFLKDWIRYQNERRELISSIAIDLDFD